MSYNNYNSCAFMISVCVIFTQFCSLNSNVINNDNNLYERRMSGKISVGKSDSMNNYINNNNKNNRIETKVNFQPNPELNDRSSQSELKLYGFASPMDPRAQISYQNLMPHNNQPVFQQNSYQQLFEGMQMNDGMQSFPMPQHLLNHPNSDEEALNVIKNYLKKYDFKRYFLKKILGDSYEKEEGHEEGFFANKHLRRHGAAGMAAKVFGELIGIKIRKSIEGFGDTISGYAKEMTTNGFVSIANAFTKLFRRA